MAFRHPLNSARDEATSGRPAQGDNSMRSNTLPESDQMPTEVRRIPPEVLEEFGVSRVQQLAGHLEDARRELMEGMGLVDRSDERDLHVWVGQLVNSIDDLRAHMVKRNFKGES